jgi:uncharacterized protein YfcZ (UPF0381/DUF406 family)
MSEPCDGCASRATHYLCDACCAADIDRLTKERDEARAEAAHFKEIARQRAEDFLAANAERVKAVERANNPSAEVPCTYCGIKFKAEEFHCGDCMEELDDAVLVETVRGVAERQREACAESVYPEGIHWAAVVRATPLVTEEN